jgi:hypothetical protein
MDGGDEYADERTFQMSEQTATITSTFEPDYEVLAEIIYLMWRDYTIGPGTPTGPWRRMAEAVIADYRRQVDAASLTAVFERDQRP